MQVSEKNAPNSVRIIAFYLIGYISCSFSISLYSITSIYGRSMEEVVGHSAFWLIMTGLVQVFRGIVLKVINVKYKTISAIELGFLEILWGAIAALFFIVSIILYIGQHLA